MAKVIQVVSRRTRTKQITLTPKLEFLLFYHTVSRYQGICKYATCLAFELCFVRITKCAASLHFCRRIQRESDCRFFPLPPTLVIATDFLLITV